MGGRLWCCPWGNILLTRTNINISQLIGLFKKLENNPIKDDKSHHKECIGSSDSVPIGTCSTETIGANILTHPSVVNPLLSVHDHVSILYCKGCWVAECTDGHRQVEFMAHWLAFVCLAPDNMQSWMERQQDCIQGEYGERVKSTTGAWKASIHTFRHMRTASSFCLKVTCNLTPL